MEIRVDVDRLRDHMKEEYGTAACNSSPVAMSDMWDIERIDGYELCKKAEELGINLKNFESR